MVIKQTYNAVDHRALLLKYMDHVVFQYNGTLLDSTFKSEFLHGAGGTEEQWKQLRELSHDTD